MKHVRIHGPSEDRQTTHYAAHPIDALIQRRIRGSYDGYSRDKAIEAYDAGRACLLYSSGHQNQFAMRAADEVNGGGDLSEIIERKAAEQRRDLDWTRQIILSVLIPANAAGKAMIEEAKWPRFAQAAE